MISATPLIDFWRRCGLSAAPFVHPDDVPVLRAKGGKRAHFEARDFASYTAPDEHFWTDRRFHLGLRPIPYAGDLMSADIVILLLNPGISPGDYYAEQTSVAFCGDLERNIAQEFAGAAFPFIWFDPKFSWHSGFHWWERRLRDVLTEIAKRHFRGVYLDAMHDLANRIAHVELVPYRSVSFYDDRAVANLPSVQAARGYAQTELRNAAERGTQTVIVTRKQTEWGLASSNYLVVYPTATAQSSSLKKGFPGGDAILGRYAIAPRALRLG